MTTEQWLNQYEQTRHKFEWFIYEYFPEYLEPLRKALNNQMPFLMLSMLNDIWFWLPDNKFNVVENPSGWQEFLALLEDPPE